MKVRILVGQLLPLHLCPHHKRIHWPPYPRLFGRFHCTRVSHLSVRLPLQHTIICRTKFAITRRQIVQILFLLSHNCGRNHVRIRRILTHEWRVWVHLQQHWTVWGTPAATHWWALWRQHPVRSDRVHLWWVIVVWWSGRRVCLHRVHVFLVGPMKVLLWWTETRWKERKTFD